MQFIDWIYPYVELHWWHEFTNTLNCNSVLKSLITLNFNRNVPLNNQLIQKIHSIVENNSVIGRGLLVGIKLNLLNLNTKTS